MNFYQNEVKWFQSVNRVKFIVANEDKHGK